MDRLRLLKGLPTGAIVVAHIHGNRDTGGISYLAPGRDGVMRAGFRSWTDITHARRSRQPDPSPFPVAPTREPRDESQLRGIGIARARRTARASHVEPVRRNAGRFVQAGRTPASGYVVPIEPAPYWETLLDARDLARETRRVATVRPETPHALTAADLPRQTADHDEDA